MTLIFAISVLSNLGGWVGLRHRPLVSWQTGPNQNKLLKFRSLHNIVYKSIFCPKIIHYCIYTILKSTYDLRALVMKASNNFDGSGVHP